MPQFTLARFGLQRQISIVLGSVMALVVVTLTGLLLTLISLRNSTQAAVLVHGREYRLANRIAIATLECRRYEKDLFLNLDDPAAFDQYEQLWRQSYADLQQAIANYATAAIHPEDQALVSIWEQQTSDYGAAVTGVLSNINSGQITTPQAANTALSPSKEVIRQLTTGALAIAMREADETLAAELRMEQTFTSALWLIGGGGLLLLLLFMFSARYPRTLVAPLLKLHSGMQHFTSTQEFTPVATTRGDELGALITSFNTMAQTLQARTTELEQQRQAARAAQARAEQSQADLAQQLAVIEQQNTVIREMSIPMLPISERVTMLPLIGALDSLRMQIIQQHVLSTLERTRTAYLIIDVTGVPLIDTLVGASLLQLKQGAQLLGVHVVMVGMRPEVAQTLVQLGIPLGEVEVYSSLQQGIASLLHRNN